MREFSSRYGKFTFTRDQMINHTELVRLVMSECLIMRCDHDFPTDSFEYTALSEAFDHLDFPKVNVPYYEWTLPPSGLKCDRITTHDNPREIELAFSYFGFDLYIKSSDAENFRTFMEKMKSPMWT